MKNFCGVYARNAIAADYLLSGALRGTKDYFIVPSGIPLICNSLYSKILIGDLWKIRSNFMIKRIILGVVWFVAIYFSVCLISVAATVGVLWAKNLANAFAAGARSGSAIVTAYHMFFLIGSIIAAIVGTWFGLLPGTKKKNRRI